MTMRSLTLAALCAFAVAAVPIAAGQASAPDRTTDPGITNGAKQRALTSARQRWKSQGASSYTFLLSIACFCPPTADVKMVVRNGSPAKGTPANLRDQATVPRLFRTIQRAIDAKAARLTVSYGPRGVPQSIYIDRDVRIADEEAGYTIRKFTRLKR